MSMIIIKLSCVERVEFEINPVEARTNEDLEFHSSTQRTMSGEAAVASSVPSFKKRQDDAKKKQSGEMAPDLDQDGKMINPHNPDFITKVPWYLGSSGPTLKHHNIQKSDHFLSLSEADQLFYQKIEAQRTSLEAQSQKTFKKGSCKNCGATTHKEKDCVERPRSTKKSAWKSGLDIAPDEIVLKLEEYGKVSFSAKRDQWKGEHSRPEIFAVYH